MATTRIKLLAIGLCLGLPACANSQGASKATQSFLRDGILITSSPADGATVRRPLNELVLEFARPVALAEVTIAAPDGTIMPIMLSPAGEGVHYVIPLPRLESGHYDAAWRAVAQGRALHGKIRFSVR